MQYVITISVSDELDNAAPYSFATLTGYPDDGYIAGCRKDAIEAFKEEHTAHGKHIEVEVVDISADE